MIYKIECPKCQQDSKPVNNWFDGFAKTKDGLYYFKCANCKVNLGSTLGIAGKLAIWEKSKEEK